MIPVRVRHEKLQRERGLFTCKLVRVPRHHAAVNEKRLFRAEKQEKPHAAFIKRKTRFIDLQDVHDTPPAHIIQHLKRMSTDPEKSLTFQGFLHKISHIFS